MRWFLVDRITECDPGKSVVGIKVFSRSEVFFQDHFNGFPIVPGVLQIEMMATTGGKAIKLAHNEWLPVLGSVKNAKFYRNIVPGDQCHIYVDIEKMNSHYCVANGRVEVDGKKVSQAQIVYGILAADKLTTGYVDPVIDEFRKRQAMEGELSS